MAISIVRFIMCITFIFNNWSKVRARTLELERANRSLQVSQAAAEEASRAKSEFLANMSHEIRSIIL